MRLYLFSEYLIMQVLLESIVIVYVMAKLQCAGTLTMNNMDSMTAVQMKGMSIVKYTESLVPVRHFEECIWVIIRPFAAMWRKVW